MAAAAAVALAGCATTQAPFVTPATAPGVFVAGYHAYWAGSAWEDYPWDALTELYFFELEVDARGGFLERHGWPDEWAALAARAASEGVQLTPTVSMHDADAFEALFADPSAVERLVVGVVGLLEATPALAGVHLDFEVFRPVDGAVRDGFTAFVARLASRLRALDPQLALSVFTLAFDDADVYNERALAELADYLVVQGYDYHSLNEGTTGPVAALTGWGRLNWTNVVDRFVELGVPARRIVMAVPLYGYQWPAVGEEPGAATRGPGVAAPLTAPPDVLPELPRARAQAERHGVRRDPVSGSPYYAYRDADGWHQGWYEDAESLRAKYDFVLRRGLGGIAIFPLAYGVASDWESLRAAVARTP
jgi:spore germination protein YaaH